MKEFDLEKAKAGAKVCTRDGREVRIICFDANNEYPIIALVRSSDGDEALYTYDENGMFFSSRVENNADLMLAREKNEGWVNVFGAGDHSYLSTEIFRSEKSAKEFVRERSLSDYTATIKIEWEE